ncbi:hypothetical protein WR25_16741 [Diploscapter pachys]|uniref:Uncharacterized protein n=1 Tax=Diploscapter pachys TaxID=2018661 RepID=A0A2A2JKY3_9BILA|nr:hypothetical protein WR25_16741 [Diploscapter pachys]
MGLGSAVPALELRSPLCKSKWESPTCEGLSESGSKGSNLGLFQIRIDDDRDLPGGSARIGTHHRFGHQVRLPPRVVAYRKNLLIDGFIAGCLAGMIEGGVRSHWELRHSGWHRQRHAEVLQITNVSLSLEALVEVPRPGNWLVGCGEESASTESRPVVEEVGWSEIWPVVRSELIEVGVAVGWGEGPPLRSLMSKLQSPKSGIF